MTFDYSKDTKEHYKDPSVAEAYHAEFTQRRGLGSLRFRIIASRERMLTLRMLKLAKPEMVLDLPAGTGKMAPVYASLGVKVVAADISEEMLRVAKRFYTEHGLEQTHFQVCDAEDLSPLSAHRFDAVVCVRLMHRVPAEVRKSILKQFATAARYTIVSYGIESPFHKLRRKLRRRLLGGLDVSTSAYTSLSEVREELSTHHSIRAHAHVFPLLSGEHFFLLERK